MITALRFKLTVTLPLVVDGGLSKWKIQMDHFGKGDCNYAVVAESLVTGEVIKITSGRTREIENRTTGLHFLAQPNTLLFLIARKLIREGRAELLGKKCLEREPTPSPTRTPPLVFRFKCPLPVTVNGGLTNSEIAPQLRKGRGRAIERIAMKFILERRAEIVRK